ncbi:MAG: hypothetical protein ACE5F1_09100, partial [Planctomycetota bacterium]
MSWLAGFSQASLLCCYLVLGFSSFLAAEDLSTTRRLPLAALGSVGLGLCLGLGLAMVQILPAMETAGQSSRASAPYEVLASRALPPSQLLELVLPGQLAPPGDHSPPGALGSRPSFLALFLTASWMREPLRDGYLNHTETAFGFGVWPLLFALASFCMLCRRSDEGCSRAVLAFLWTASLGGLAAAMAV